MNGEVLAMIFTVITLIIIVTFPIFAWRKLRVDPKVLEDDTYVMKYGSLYEGTKIDTFGLYYVEFYMCRRIFFSILVVFLVSYPTIQLMGTLISSLIVLTFVLK